MTKKIGLFIVVMLLFLLFTAYSSKKDDHPQNYIQTTDAVQTYTDYIDVGIRIAVAAGDVYGDVARNFFKAKDAPEYATVADILESLRMGRSDAALLSHGYVKQLQDSGMYPDFDYLWVPEDVYINTAGPIFNTTELRDQYNEWFRGISADGTWQEIVDRWIGVPLPAQEDIPRFEFTGENGTLRLCDTGNYPPLTYFDANNDPVGLDIEMASRFAQHMGMKPEFTMMTYEAIGPYVVSGRADMSACALAISDEQYEGLIFGEPNIITQAVLIVPKKVAEPKAMELKAAKPANGKARDYTYFADKEIAVITGALTYITTEKIGGKPVNYNDSSSAAEDVRQGRVAGYMHALTAVQIMAAQLDGFEVITIPKEIFSAQIAGISHDQTVIDRFNSFLSVLKTDGTLADIKNRWFGDALNLNVPIPEIHNSGSNGVLKVAVCSDSIPYVYVGANGKFSGFSIELMLRFGAYEEKTIEFSDMEFSGLIPYIVSKKADFGIANMAITEERRKSVMFTNSFVDEQHGILSLKKVITDVSGNTNSDLSYIHFVGKSPSQINSGFIRWLKTGIERNLITDNRWKLIVNGLGVTMLIAFAAQFFGTLFGFFVCFVLTRKKIIVKKMGDFYCALIHGTPMVVLLMITYYIIFGKTHISNIITAIAAFTMVMGASIAQNLKGAIDTIDPVEIEAARSIGFSAVNAFLTVTFPQAVRRALPGYTNGFIELVKATAIVGFIAIQDLTRAGDIIRSRTYDAYFPLLFVAVIYLIVTTICVQLFKLVVKKVNRGAEQ